MTRDEGVVLIKQVLGFRNNLDATIVTNMKFAQIRLERSPTKPWWLVSEDSFTTTSATEERIAVPLDFLEEVDQAVLKYVPDDPDADEVDLEKDEYDVLRKNFRGKVPGPPEAYALVGGYFRLFPTPDAVYTIRQIFYQDDATLDSNIENGWMKWNPMLLLGLAGGTLAVSLRDTIAKMEFSAWEAEGRLLMPRMNIAREMANMDMQVGGPN